MNFFKVLFITFCFVGTIMAQSSPYFASEPSLSPDGKNIYFVYDSDIWQVPFEGGEALRLVSMEGNESHPRVSPDGKWLAFSSEKYGNNDIFTLEFATGKITQLTFHEASDVVYGWSWDSRTIYFSSDRYNHFGSYSISAHGGTPQPIFGKFFTNSDELVIAPDGGYLFTSSRETNSQRQRKRYKGPYNPDILYYHPGTKEFKKLTTYEGKDFNPTVDASGNIYYISDQDNDEFNLYTLKNGKPTALTQFNSSIKTPYVAAQGHKIVFEKDYQLFTYDVASGKSSKVEFTAPAYYVLDKENGFKTDKITAYDVSPDNNKIAFISRGVLFVSDIEGKFIREILNDGERISEVKWLDNNKDMLVVKTYQGFPNLYRVSAQNKEVVRLTKDARSNRSIHLNSDKSKAVYLSGRDEVRLLDLKTWKSETVVKDEIWAFQNSDPSFSPDGRYILFTAVRNFEKDIFVHNITENKTYNLTNTGVSEADPWWSEDGKYIYYSSNRTEPAYPFGMKNASIYRMALDWYADDFISDGYEKLFEKEDRDSTKSSDKKDKSVFVNINFEGLKDRIEAATKKFGSQSRPIVFSDGDNTVVFYNSNEDRGTNKLFKKVYSPYENPKEEKVSDAFTTDIIKVNKQFYYLSGGSIYKYNLKSNKADKINLKYNFEKNLEAEFHQMFEEVWAGMDENFYDEKFHGRDWPALRDYYKNFIPHINNRNDLRTLLNDMLGELNSSHLGFRSTGSEEKTRQSFKTAETGLIFSTDNPYKIERILGKSPAMALRNDVLPGDILIEINGEKIDHTKNRNAYFSNPDRKKELNLVFDRNGQNIAINVSTTTYSKIKDLLYDEWIAANRENVRKWSDDKIAYAYMKNMSESQQESFLLDMVDKANDREGLILDLRFNLGGNVHDKVLSFLSQRPYMQWKYREGEITPQSNFSPSAHPIVLLTNQVSLSDAEMTSAGFKALNLGKIIGMPTYRWIIFTSGKSLVDGSFFRVPAWGVYTLEGENLEFTGVTPDIEIDNTFEDYLNDNDPQLRRAVEEILNGF